MKRAASFCLAASLLAAGVRAESLYIVKTTDLRKEVAYEVMTREQLSELKQQVQAEERVYPTALAAARKAWEADANNKGTSFPGSGLSPRKVQESGPYTEEVARKKAEAANKRVQDAAFEEKAKSPKGSKKLSDREKEKQAQEKAREAARKARTFTAEALLRTQLDAALQGGRRPAGAGASPGAATNP